MKETKVTSSVLLEVLNPATGNRFLAEGKSTEETRYYKIKRLTSRVNSMDLLNILSEVCKSPKDLKLMNTLLDEANANNRIIITNISAKAIELGVARSKLNALLSNAVKESLLHKLDKGTYVINPYVLIGRRIRSNELREALQREWDKF